MIELRSRVYQVSSAYLLEHLVPKLPDGLDIESICDRVKENGDLILSDREEYFWNGFQSIPKRKDRYTPTHTSKILGGIFEGLVRATEETMASPPTSILIYRAKKRQLCWTDERNSNKPTASLYLRDSSCYQPSSNIRYNTAVTISLESHKSHEHYSVEHLMGCTRKIMSADRCRRFAYGIHITDFVMHIWFFSRSSMIISDPIDINEDYMTTARILLSFLYASKADLGWDTAISTEFIDGERSYTFDVLGIKITTTDSMSISDNRADSLPSAGTRVNEVYRIVNGEKAEKVVLKEFWIDDDGMSEAELRALLLEDIIDDGDREYVDSHLLTPIVYGRVKIGEVEEHTEIVLQRDNLLDHKNLYKFPYTLEEQRVLERAARGIDPRFEGHQKLLPVRGYPARYEKKLFYPHRHYYRILYKEFAIPICKLTNSKDILLVLIDVIETLLRIHAAGWVHRDISINNLYLYEDPFTGEKRGMIGDLEFAMRVKTGSEDDEYAVGTPGFMAVEICKQHYLFPPFGNGRYICGDSESDSLGSIEKTMRPVHKGKKKKPRIGFHHNYIHDIESVWWVAVWALLSFEKAPGNKYMWNVLDSSSEIYEPIKFRENLFRCLYRELHRESTLQGRRNFLNCTRNVPEYFMEFRITLEELRQLMVNTYFKNEKDKSKPILLNESASLHTEFLKRLRMIELDSFEVKAFVMSYGDTRRSDDDDDDEREEEEEGEGKLKEERGRGRGRARGRGRRGGAGRGQGRARARGKGKGRGRR